MLFYSSKFDVHNPNVSTYLLLVMAKTCKVPSKSNGLLIKIILPLLMRLVLNETTNSGRAKDLKTKTALGDKDRVLLFLKDMAVKTKDHTLKYDLSKCIEIVEGKENQEVIDLKNALEEALVENEALFAEKCELAVTLECMKTEKNG